MSFIFIAYAVVILTGIVILLSIRVVAFNQIAIRREVLAKENRSTLRLGLLSYLKENIGLAELQKVILRNEELLVSLVAQLTEELGESARFKFNELFEANWLATVVQKELKELDHAKNWRKRQRAATYLPYIAKNQIIINALLVALEDKVLLVRFSAAHSLAKIKAIDTIIPILEHLSLPDEWPIERTIEIINEMGKEAVSTLMNYLSLPSAQDYCKVFAIAALGMQRVKAAVPIILTHLTYPDKEIRIQSAKALGNIGATEAIVQLSESMHDSEWEVRAASANSLGLIHNNKAIPVLVNALCDSAWWVRYNSADALAGLGNEGITALENALTHNDKFAQEVSRLVLQEHSIIKSNQITIEIKG